MQQEVYNTVTGNNKSDYIEKSRMSREGEWREEAEKSVFIVITLISSAARDGVVKIVKRIMKVPFMLSLDDL